MEFCHTFRLNKMAQPYEHSHGWAFTKESHFPAIASTAFAGQMRSVPSDIALQHSRRQSECVLALV